jgi:DNA-binding transcriptional MerR regulator
MNFYQINDLERLSGVKAHTIRIWEKRYGLIMPHRTDTNIRYYDDIQLKKILNVAALSMVGFRISKIAAMEEKELKAQVKKSQSLELSDKKYEFYINDLIVSMLDFDEPTFNQLLDAIMKQFGVQEAMIKVVYPFLHKTGVLWRVDETMPVQEHFATTLLKRKLFTLISLQPKAKHPDKKIVLFLPSNEWHEIGLLFAEYLLRLQGYVTVNLGQNVPFVDIELVIQKVQPQYLLTFLISDSHEDEIIQLQTLLLKKYKNIHCLLAGPHTKMAPFVGKKNLNILNNPDDILKVF